MKTSRTIPIFLLLIVASFLAYFFVGRAPAAAKITWGVNFSQTHAQYLGLDWRQTYLAILDDLKTKDIKLTTEWDVLETAKDTFNFDDLDWQIQQAKQRGAKILLVIGRKTPRWPECHTPDWAKGLSEPEQQAQVMELLNKVVLRYKNENTIWAWQVENEPFFYFGVCPKTNPIFLRQEINLVKSLDKTRPVIISDSGESSAWMQAGSLGDILSITMYRKTQNKIFGVIDYPWPPVFYWRKALIINKIFGKKVICGELQAEPWGVVLLYDSSVAEQKKTMDLTQFKANIEYAQKTGLDDFYLWGGEWWYWMKVKQNDSSIWDEAKKLWN